jgi:hypothetical protein
LWLDDFELAPESAIDSSADESSNDASGKAIERSKDKP